MRTLSQNQSLRLLLASTLCFLFVAPAMACSRVVYLGPAGAVVTGRTMDWTQSMETNLWAFPAGLKRNGNAGPQSLQWQSKYGSIVATCYDGLSADGLNEKGLVANILYLSSSVYPKLDGKRPALSIAGWAQYVLDNFATVAEAVAALKNEPFQLAGLTLPGGHAGTGHLSISDATGDSAVFEYLDGKLVIHHGKQFTVMTNDPPYDQQLALNGYWKEIGGGVMLPGTERPADRFVRASFYLGEAPQTTDETQQIATMFSIIRNVSVPFGAEHPGQPNVAATLWRTVADQQRLTYYFEMTDRPNVFWVELKKLDFSPGQPIRMLPVEGAAVRAGEVSQQFAPSRQFAFLPGGDK
jgi:penicillin V acylase-like amidase (Ntn superfamily)